MEEVKGHGSRGLKILPRDCIGGMEDLVRVLMECVKSVRDEVLPVLGSPEAVEELGVGAGGDKTARVDVVAEEAILETLSNSGIPFRVVSEERGVLDLGVGEPRYYAVLDPIDGSTNALRGIPFTATSIAFSKTSNLHDVVAGVVADLGRGDTYWAEAGKGAWKNGVRASTSGRTVLEDATIGVDFKSLAFRGVLDTLTDVLAKVGHVRHFGANALEVCYVADGRMDAFVDIRGRLRVTDIAAAYLIVREAGGVMLRPDGSEVEAELSPTSRVSFVAASTRELFEEIRNALRV